MAISGRIATLMYLVAVHWFKISETTDLTDAHLRITSLLLEHFRVATCVFVTDDINPLFWYGSSFSETKKYFVSVWTHEQIREYMMKPSDTRSERTVIVLRANEESFKSLQQISQKRSLSSAIWIMFSNSALDKSVFRGIYIPFNCEFIYVNERDNIHILTEMYRIENGSDIETYNFGFWSQDVHLSVNEELLYRRRKTLKGHTFAGVIGNVPPYIVLQEPKPGKKEFRGYLYETWRELEHRINFRSQLTLQQKDETYRDLDFRNSQFAVLPVAYDTSTLDQMDITFPIYVSRSYLFGHRPGSELEWDSYLKPFDADTWWASLAWMTTSSIALTILYKIAWIYGTSEKEADYFIFTFAESFATVFRAMCMQGSDVTPRSNACRLLFLSIYLTALVVSSAFSAALFSLLTIPTSRAPFNDFVQVTENAAYKMGVLRGSEIYGTLQDYTSKFPASIQSELLRKADASADGHPRNLLDGLNTVCRNKMYIMMSELPYVLHAMQNMTRECQEKVMPSGPVLLKSFIGFGMKKGSPYKEIINLHVLMMRNEGITQRLLLNNWPPQIPSVQATWVRVTLADISPILYMFGLGAVIALVLLFVENIHGAVNKSRSDSKKGKSGQVSRKTPSDASRVWMDKPKSDGRAWEKISGEPGPLYNLRR